MTWEEASRSSGLVPLHHIKSFLNRGGVKIELGDYNGAIQDLTFSITNFHDLTLAHWNRAVAKENLSNIKGAFEDISVVISINPDYAEAYFFRGRLEISAGDKDRGCKDLNKALEMNYQDALELFNTFCK